MDRWPVRSNIASGTEVVFAPRTPRPLWSSALFALGGPLNPWPWISLKMTDGPEGLIEMLCLIGVTIFAAFAAWFLYRQPRNLRSLLFLAAKSALFAWGVIILILCAIWLSERPPTSNWSVGPALVAPLMVFPMALFSAFFVGVFGIPAAFVWAFLARVLCFTAEPQPAEIAAP